MAKPRPQAQPEREYTDDVSYLAWSQARFYPGTTHAAWEAYLRGRGQRPVAWGTTLTLPARAGECADSGIVYPVSEYRGAA